MVHKQGNWTKVILDKLQYRIWNPRRISKSKKINLLKSVYKQGNQALINKNIKNLMYKMDILTFLYLLGIELLFFSQGT